jgi:hypothetical protein
MLRAIEFRRFLTPNVFKVLADDGGEWVVKAKKKWDNSKQLFSKYFAGLLAEDFGLSTPRVEIIELNQGILENLDASFDKSVNKAVARQFINDLKAISIVPPEENKLNLQETFGSDCDFKDFYAYVLFLAWIDLKEPAELYVTKDGMPIFLDFDCAFGGDVWCRAPEEHHLDPRHWAPFCEGIILDFSLFEPWILRLKKLDGNKYNCLLDTIPTSWKAPNNYIGIKGAWVALLFDNIDGFLEELKSHVNEKLSNPQY